MSPQVCWQYLIKKEKAAQSGAHPACFREDDVRLMRLDYTEARNFILQYEWLGHMGAANHCYGLRVSGNLACVVAYAPPASSVSYRRLLGDDIARHLLQLSRGASAYWAPKWAPSRLIAQTLRILSRQYAIRVVVAYADPEAGEVGTIYQACNALYCGLTDAGRARIYIINGKRYHPRTVHRKFGSRSRPHLLRIDPTFQTELIHPKHRYFFPLGSQHERRQIVERLTNVIKPYPKRLSTSDNA
jgi:hypothetical protein